jgi:formylglycine-generating enzyme required for sulfatase activity
VVDVFISYRRVERSEVEPIKDRLEALGLKVFFDIHGIDGGADFPSVIDTNLRAAKAVLACWSPAYFERKPPPDWCMVECRFGIIQQKLVPVAIARFAGDAPPVDMHGINYFDLTAWRGQDEHEDWARALAKLSRCVGREFGERSAAPESPDSSNLAGRLAEGITAIGRTAVAVKSAAEIAQPDVLLPKMIGIPAGEFMMGAPVSEHGRKSWERPQRRVRVAAFELGKHPITFAEWDSALAVGAKLSRPTDEGWGRDQRPVINVSWEDAQAYIDWLNSRTSGGYRLPSEAEWEYACRAGSTTRYSYGDDESELGEYSWFEANSDRQSRPVGTKRPNAFGLYDMNGNVWEWCEDVWHKNYKGAPADSSAWITSGDDTHRVHRGGAWNDSLDWLRSAAREGHPRHNRGCYNGFRIARTV